MTTNPPSGQSPRPASIFDGYAPTDGVFDEFCTAGGVRPHWQPFVDLIDQLGANELVRRWEQASRLIRENGMTYNAYGDPDHVTRPWNLDALPLLIGADQWRNLSAGLVQRARLLNLVLTDIYGPQRLLTSGLLPASLVFSHPGFRRVFHGQRHTGCFLHFCAFDLARAPDGAWWVIGDRTDAPFGVGYALENRIVMSRMLPNVVRQCNVHRLAPFFIALQETLRRMAPEHRANPRIVLLSQGPANPNYFEDSYLARYLGYTLVESGDLAVRDDRVFLKTLGGLLPVDVIFRRLGDGNSDPLELHGEPSLGVAGLLQAVRAGNVAVANGLGSSLVESSAFIPYLANLCQQLLGEALVLPSVATWWCGTKDARGYVLKNVDRLNVRSAFRVDRRDPLSTEQLRARTGSDLATAIAASPTSFVGQEEIARSSVPVWRDRSLRPSRLAMRVFLVASKTSYVVLPGGLVRVSPSAEQLDFSVLAGEESKDVWVLADGPVRDVSLLRTAGGKVEFRRSGAELPSRVADNLFWLGRNIERAESTARLLRPVLARLMSESHHTGGADLTALLRCLATQGQIEPGFVVEGIKEQMPSIEVALPAAVLGKEHTGSLRATIAAMYFNASLVRDRLSLDSWRIVQRLEYQLAALANPELSDLMELLNRLIIDLAAFDGLVEESMTRTQGWRFLDLGRRLERALHTIVLVRSALATAGDGDGEVLEAVLEAADSLMTYRARYLASMQLPTVLDLLLTDETNPRSLAFQLAEIAEHVENLPRDQTQPHRGPEQRIAMSALNRIRAVDADALCEKRTSKKPTGLEQTMANLAEQLPKLSELISHKYLIHAGAPRQLAEG
jgi:uncharacterized circularly permuted ATP-grasp superfamily protein/uncharacterized alpha-E superfamily protein